MYKRGVMEKLYQILQDLGQEEIIIVEGKRDKATLSRLGIDSKKIMQISNKRMESAAKKLEHYEKVVCLIDTDKAGEKLYKRLKQIAVNVNFDERYREKIFSMVPFSDLESLDNFIAKNGRKIFGAV